MTSLFRPLTPVAARWRFEDGSGLEHLNLRPSGDTIVADGVIIGNRGGVPYGVRYHIVCDAGWATLALHVDSTDGRGIHLVSDGHGRWSDGAGGSRPEFDGCVDVDLAGSPFTNTLPIRRHDLSPEKGAVEFRMLYVPFRTFEPAVDEQRYRCLKPGLYRYEAVDRSFAADLSVDEDGLVIDYPSLFHRVLFDR
jgi:hypothetical protein